MKRIKNWYWGILDIAEEISDDLRAQECFEITLGSLPWGYINPKRKYLTVSSDPDIILNDAANLDCDYCFIQTYGHFVNSHFYVLVCDEIDKEEFLIKGHILDKTQPRFSSQKNQWFCLHNQCVVINLEKYRQLNRPQFMTTKTNLIEPIRSEENIHDDYTPHWIAPSENRVYVSSPGFGNGLIEASFENGLTVSNFFSSRIQKFHLYPEYVNSYNNALKTLENINKIRYEREIWFWNTDNQRDYKIELDEPVSTIYCAASGFIPFKIAQENIINEETTFVHYDISLAGLHFREYQLKYWNGIDYIQFSTDYLNSNESFGYGTGPESTSEKWEDILIEFGGEENWLKLWHNIKKCRHIFKHVDITKDVEQIIIPGKYSIFWLTNCFWYHHAHKNGLSKRIELYSKFINTMQENNIEWLFGSDCFGRRISKPIKEYSIPNYIELYKLETYFSN